MDVRALLCLLWSSVVLVKGYIPATSTNNITALVSDSQDFVELIFPAGGPQGTIRDTVSRQLVSDQTNATIVGVNYGQRGALVHFSEANATTFPPSVVPWVALICCDTNGTAGSYTLENDIFTMSRDRGATAALLYSLVGQACVINQDYLLNFQKPLDVYTTTSLQTARVIESLFSNVSPFAYWFSSTLLNDSAPAIWSALNQTEVVETPSSVIAALSSYYNSVYSVESASMALSGTITSSFASSAVSGGNDGGDGGAMVTSSFSGQRYRRQLSPTLPAGPTPVTNSPTPASPAGASSPPATATPSAVSYLIALVGNVAANYTTAASASASASPQQANNGPNTSLAMIILYAITGCVTLLFLVVILSGAIRAIRHPERYGPRARAGAGGAAQGRAMGISRAILDSIPLVRYSRNTGEAQASPADPLAKEDDEALEMGERRNSVESTQMVELPDSEAVAVATLPATPRHARRSSTMSSTSKLLLTDAPVEAEAPAPSSPTAAHAPSNADQDHTCPICLVGFEEGEDLRILPCDGRHRFHQDCIDPWLLNVSSLCPLCRWDVTMKKGEPALHEAAEDEAEEEAAAAESPISPATQSRFRRAFQRESTAGVGFTPTRFTRYLAQVRAAASTSGPLGRRRSARAAAVSVTQASEAPATAVPAPTSPEPADAEAERDQ